MLSTSCSVIRRCASQTSSLGAAAARLKHSLPDLKYDFNALEPYISAEIMQLHYTKHHQTYVNNLNVAEQKLGEALQANDVQSVIQLQPALKFNGGGHINHSIFWENLSPKGGGEPKGDLMDAIRENFGTFERMKKEMVAASVAVQGSGWGWLGYNPFSGRIRVATCANQDPLEATTGLIPLFGIDVWEHAYYLQYKNVRPDYVSAIFNVANWDDVAQRLANARKAN